MQRASDFFSKLKQQLASYLSVQQIAEVVKTYQFAYLAHDGQLRASGVPYITHPVAVAVILAELHLDCDSINAAILHDVLEDTAVDKAQLLAEFGGTVTELVDGVSTLTHMSFGSRAEEQAENFRKMILAMSRDIRVIIVKLADRLHNMRTLGSVSREKQRRKALETLEIYAPIAHRLGMHMFCTELEDLGFYYLYPIRYRVLKESVYKARGNRREMIHSLMQNVQKHIDKSSINIIDVTGREKHLYSLYTKMRLKDLPFSEIMDVYALRIVVSEITDCYQLLGIVHDLYKPIHNRFKDYIAIPKANGYQSLHTTLIGPYGVPVEIQIRTENMDYMAERGIAAHWVYKDQQEAPSAAETKTRSWLEGVLDIQKHAGTSLEFIENVKVDLYPTNIYVFTPTGKIFALPRGATVVDFAYAVHTDIGNSCITAKINRRLSPL
ncbi:MAG: bifunctional GTP diphosphokinase/guanosine-3',5'-bis(diphosphate) 3'-diphosphatase, partial [Legionellales bacterium]